MIGSENDIFPIVVVLYLKGVRLMKSGKMRVVIYAVSILVELLVADIESERGKSDEYMFGPRGLGPRPPSLLVPRYLCL